MKTVHEILRDGLIAEQRMKAEQDYQTRQYKLWLEGLKGFDAWRNARH